jgi:hypothetical protein
LKAFCSNLEDVRLLGRGVGDVPVSKDVSGTRVSQVAEGVDSYEGRPSISINMTVLVTTTENRNNSCFVAI